MYPSKQIPKSITLWKTPTINVWNLRAADSTDLQYSSDTLYKSTHLHGQASKGWPRRYTWRTASRVVQFHCQRSTASVVSNQAIKTVNLNHATEQWTWFIIVNISQLACCCRNSLPVPLLKVHVSRTREPLQVVVPNNSDRRCIIRCVDDVLVYTGHTGTEWCPPHQSVWGCIMLRHFNTSTRTVALIKNVEIQNKQQCAKPWGRLGLTRGPLKL